MALTWTPQTAPTPGALQLLQGIFPLSRAIVHLLGERASIDPAPGHRAWTRSQFRPFPTPPKSLPSSHIHHFQMVLDPLGIPAGGSGILMDFGNRECLGQHGGEGGSCLWNSQVLSGMGFFLGFLNNAGSSLGPGMCSCVPFPLFLTFLDVETSVGTGTVGCCPIILLFWFPAGKSWAANSCGAPLPKKNCPRGMDKRLELGLIPGERQFLRGLFLGAVNSL